MRFSNNKTRWIPALLNIVGLSIAFSISLILMSQVWWDFRYDRFKGGRDVYVVEQPSFDEGFYSKNILRPFIQTIADCSPDIVATCDYYATRDDPIGWIEIKDQSGEYISARGISFAKTETSVLDVFDISLVKGRREDFAQKGDALISESTAKVWFPNKDPVGEPFIYDGRNEGRIIGIYKDRKDNESMINGLLIHEGDTDIAFPLEIYNPHSCYIKLSRGSDAKAVNETIGKLQFGDYSNYIHDLRITQLHDLWFSQDKDSWGGKVGGNKVLCRILTAIAIFFLAIAAFNYVNFAMAAIPVRIKDINTRKVFGASRKSLILRQLLQSFIIVTFSFLVGVLTMKTLSGTAWATFLSGSMDPWNNIAVVILGGIAAVIIAIVSGLFPALYSTSFQPAIVLKGSFSLTSRGGGLRIVTIGLQYVLSFVFIICAIVLQRQTSFMVNNNDLGFNHDLVLKMEGNGFRQVKDIMERLRDIPGVKDVTRGESPIQKGLSSRSRINEGETVVAFSIRGISPEYPEFFGLNLLEGRFPLPGEKGIALVNESFIDALPSYGLGKVIPTIGDSCTIVGILKDFHTRSLENAYSPYVFRVSDKYYFNSFMIRIEPNADAWGILHQARTIYCEMTNQEEEEVEIGFLDKDIEELYEQEIRQSRLIKLSSLLSLIIALIGILGLVWFDTRFMRKEIAIKRVNGAEVRNILRQINRKYLIITAASFIIAAPAALFICQRWLEHFAFRTNMPVWLFVLAFFVVLCITLAAVTLQSWRAANANPVNNLKNE